MRLPPRRPAQELNAGFDWREIVCVSETSAKAEAERQQSLDDPEEAEWVYLKSEKTGQWLARRTPRRLEVRKDSLLDAFVTQVLNPFQG